MDQINRRALVRGILCGAATVGVGLALSPSAVEAMPIDASLAHPPEGVIEEIQWGPPPRHWHGNNWHGSRRGRRWVCWWNRGRRVCGWR
jgi:hypothetical protein